MSDINLLDRYFVCCEEMKVFMNPNYSKGLFKKFLNKLTMLSLFHILAPNHLSTCVLI